MYKKNALLPLLICWVMAALGGQCQAAEVISLAGQWRFALDRADVGTNEQWFAKKLPDRIQLPGILEAQGYGDKVSINTPWVMTLYDKFWYLRADYQRYTNNGSVKIPFLCQPPRHYLGAAWYQRDLDIPADWKNRRVVLFLERPRWKSTVWIDDREIGSEISLCTPHEFDLGNVPPGHHQLTIRLDNRMILPYRPDAHSVSDSLDDAWNGIVGKIELRSSPMVWVENVQAYPDLANQRVRLKTQIGNNTDKNVNVAYRISLTPKDDKTGPSGSQPTADTIQVKPGGIIFELNIPLTNFSQHAFLPWDEYHPNLYNLTFAINPQDARDQHSSTTVTIGLRDFHADGNQFILNGRPIYFRGTHFGGDFPLTGYPAMDVDSWKKIIQKCKDYGLNHIRFHSWCPPEAAFEAADQLGFYLQVECGMWNTFNPGTVIDQMLYDETERILRDFGNHPSLMLVSASNEAGGQWRGVLPQWEDHFSKEDPRHLFTPDTGWSPIMSLREPVVDADYLDVARISQGTVRGELGWFQSDYSNSVHGVAVPVIAHEVGQWCAYPDFGIIKKFTGFMQPGNYEIFRDSLAAHGMSDRDRDFVLASGRFQLACYKQEIEANLRTPGLNGFQLLDLHDYVGQGTALVGVLDTFWQEKGYVTADEWNRFCGPTVPLARLPKLICTTNDNLNADVEVAHYGSSSLANAAPSWRIVNATGNILISGEWPAQTIPIGKNIPLGNISAKLAGLPSPGAYKLVVSIKPTTGPAIENDWNFWLYPAVNFPVPKNDVVVTASWDEAETNLAMGRKVLYCPRSAELDWTCPPLAPLPIFWNRQMNPGWSRMLGLWCEVKHPALADFPTDVNCDWQWAEILRGVRAVNLDHFPASLQPIVQPIDDWNRNYKLGLIFECRVGPGKLMVSGINLVGFMASSPVTAQLQRSLLSYMASDRFEPKVEVTTAQMRSVLFDDRIMNKLGATVQADGNGANALIDGDPNTFWTAGNARDVQRQPHAVTITFSNSTLMRGLVIMSRQNDRNHAGDVRDYLVETSDDGTTWREAARGSLESTWDPQEVKFNGVINARELRFTALSGFGTDPTVSLAELALEYAGPKLPDDRRPMTFQPPQSTSPDIDAGAPTIRTR